MTTKSEKRPFSIPFSKPPLDYKHLRHISSELSQCGKTGYIKKELDMIVCFKCGLYHYG